MPYTPTAWQDDPDHTTPITAAELNRVETGVDAAITHAEGDGTDHTGVLAIADIDDTPVNGITDAPISSNWAFDHNADITTKHLPAQATHSGKYLTTDGTTASWGAVSGGGESISSFLLMGA